MFKFLMRKVSGQSEVVAETQRQTIERALTEVNAVLAMMGEKPKVSFDPATGEIGLELPEQMPDEALALPAPEPEVKAEPVAEVVAEDVAEVVEEVKKDAA